MVDKREDSALTSSKLKKKVTILDASQNDLIPDQPEASEAVEGEASQADQSS